MVEIVERLFGKFCRPGRGVAMNAKILIAETERDRLFL